jgi:hypothetical protein
MAPVIPPTLATGQRTHTEGRYQHLIRTIAKWIAVEDLPSGDEVFPPSGLAFRSGFFPAIVRRSRVCRGGGCGTVGRGCCCC